MAWTAPMTAVANAVFTAAQFNTNVRDNLLETMPGKATAAGRYFVSQANNAIAERQVATADLPVGAESTTSTSYTNLTTPGPAVTVTTGTTALVFMSSNVNSASATDEPRVSYAVSGATTIAASDSWALYSDAAAANDNNFGSHHLCTGLTPGSNTFTLRYRSTAGASVSFLRRRIVVIPF